MTEPTYLDHAASAPILPSAREAMMRGMALDANPSSPHAMGRAARRALEEARETVAAALGWSGEVIFTSGASEALQLALSRCHAGHRVVSAVEHDAVLRHVPDARIVPVGTDGIVDTDTIGELSDTLLAVQQVNNETGVIQPLAAIAQLALARGGVILADCAQGAGKIDLPPCDMAAISGHKFGAPPGIGALLVRDFSLLAPTGGQERGYRGGTENVPGAMAMAAALQTGTDWMTDAARMRARLEQAVLAAGGEVIAAGSPRVATIGSYRIPGLGSAVQLIRLDSAGIAVSAGSACSSGSLKPSRVLTAMGIDPHAAAECVRVSIGPETRDADIDRFLEVWTRLAEETRSRATGPAASATAAEGA